MSSPSRASGPFDQKVYDRRVYFGFGHPQPEAELKFGPNIAEWPPIPALADNMLMQVASVLRDPVTTTDELIPPGRPLPTAPTPEAGLLRPVPPGPRLRPQLRPPRPWRPAARPASPPRRSRPSWNSWARRTWPPRPTRSAPSSSPTSPATAPPGSRPPPASGCWAGAPTSAMSLPPSGTAPTASTGACSPSPWPRGEDFPCAPGDYIFVPDVKAKVLAGEDTFPRPGPHRRGSQAPHPLPEKHHRRGAGAAAHRLPHEPLRRPEQGLRRNPWNPSKCKTPSWKSTGTR